MSDKLAKAMYAATHRLPSWEMMVDSAQKGYLSGMVQDEVEGIREMARAAQEFYGIPPSAEKGAVGNAVAALTIIAVMYDDHESAGNLAMGLYEATGMAKRTLRALGAEVGG